MRQFWAGFGAILWAVVLAGCGGGTKSPSDATAKSSESSGSGTGIKPGNVSIDGSSTVYPVIEDVATLFRKGEGSAVRVTVKSSGTGGGFKSFCAGRTDISNASRPISTEEMQLATDNHVEFIELPICFDALTVAVPKANDWVDSISVDELKKMWSPEAEDTITHWNQIRPEWPNAELLLFGAGTDSGTWEYFNEAIVGKKDQCRTDFEPSEDDNVLVQGIAGSKYALGYIPYAYYEPNKDKLKALAISWSKNKTPDAVLPSKESVLDGTYNPLSRPLFLYVNRKSSDRPEVKQFVEFLLSNVGEAALKKGNLPLQDSALSKVKERFEQQITGTVFDGKPEIGVTVEELLARGSK